MNVSLNNEHESLCMIVQEHVLLRVFLAVVLLVNVWALLQHATVILYVPYSKIVAEMPHAVQVFHQSVVCNNYYNYYDTVDHCVEEWSMSDPCLGGPKISEMLINDVWDIICCHLILYVSERSCRRSLQITCRNLLQLFSRFDSGHYPMLYVFDGRYKIVRATVKLCCIVSIGIVSS